MEGIALFFALTSVAAIVGTLAEYRWSRDRSLGWHHPADTLANFNLAAGQLVMATVTTAIFLAGYAWLYSLRLTELSALLPRPAYLVVGFLLAELMQYWSHRWSHTWNLLAWGHMTHHSSSYMNMSTGMRINWFYRAYIWPLYAPLPLLGFTITEFIGFQILMNTYNLFMHTRLDLPFGPLKHVLVTPMAHRLHHTSEPAYFGNYGASLIIWDRLFGTYRDASTEVELPFGIEHNVDTTSPIELNLHWLRDLWRDAGAAGFLGALVSSTPPATAHERTHREVPTWAWWALIGLAAMGMSINQGHASMSPWMHALAVVFGVGVTVAYGRGLSGRTTGR